MRFPISRLRRLRNNAVLRDMVAETRLSIKELIYPLFVHYGQGIRRPVESMPGVFQLSVDQLPGEIRRLTPWAYLRCCCSVSPSIKTAAAAVLTVMMG